MRRLLESPTAINQSARWVGFANMADRASDYGLQFQHRTLDFRSNGTFVLPMGPGKPLGGNSSGWVAHLLEDWQVSAIFQMTSGIPMSIASRSHLYESLCSCNFSGPPWSNAPPDVASGGAVELLKGIGKVTWQGDTGSYFADYNFTRVPDPQCSSALMAESLRGLCNDNLQALALDGTIVLQNSLPGVRGNLGSNTLEGPGLWATDAALSESLQIGENRSVQIRFDATNIFNHATPNAPVLRVARGEETYPLTMQTNLAGSASRARRDRASSRQP